jgi:hypothetical protein
MCRQIQQSLHTFSHRAWSVMIEIPATHVPRQTLVKDSRDDTAMYDPVMPAQCPSEVDNSYTYQLSPRVCVAMTELAMRIDDLPTASDSSSLENTIGGTASFPGPRNDPAVSELCTLSGSKRAYGPEPSVSKSRSSSSLPEPSHHRLPRYPAAWVILSPRNTSRPSCDVPVRWIRLTSLIPSFPRPQPCNNP